MGIDAAAEELLLKIMTTCKTPLVLDADALTIISHNKELFNKIPEHTMITPHAGEFDRLLENIKIMKSGCIPPLSKRRNIVS